MFDIFFDMTALCVPFHYSCRSVSHQNMTRDCYKAQEIIHVALIPVIYLSYVSSLLFIIYFSSIRQIFHGVEKWIAHLFVRIYTEKAVVRQPWKISAAGMLQFITNMSRKPQNQMISDTRLIFQLEKKSVCLRF